MRYYIADTHFFHENLNTRMDCRGFENGEAMNRYMLDKWNQKVRKQDEVVILGDFSWGSPRDTENLLSQLHGRLCLVQGNHDKNLMKKEYLRRRFEWIRPYTELYDNRRKVILCHYPIMCYNGQYRRDENGNPTVYMLYGHVHDTQDERLVETFSEITRTVQKADANGNLRGIPSQMINCFCMYSDYEPLTLDEWIVNAKRRRERREQNDESAAILS